MGRDTVFSQPPMMVFPMMLRNVTTADELLQLVQEIAPVWLVAKYPGNVKALLQLLHSEFEAFLSQTFVTDSDWEVLLDDLIPELAARLSHRFIESGNTYRSSPASAALLLTVQIIGSQRGGWCGTYGSLPTLVAHMFVLNDALPVFEEWLEQMADGARCPPGATYDHREFLPALLLVKASVILKEMPSSAAHWRLRENLDEMGFARLLLQMQADRF